MIFKLEKVWRESSVTSISNVTSKFCLLNAIYFTSHFSLAWSLRNYKQRSCSFLCTGR